MGCIYIKKSKEPGTSLFFFVLTTFIEPLGAHMSPSLPRAVIPVLLRRRRAVRLPRPLCIISHLAIAPVRRGLIHPLRHLVVPARLCATCSRGAT